jgi:hypothetical protein
VVFFYPKTIGLIMQRADDIRAAFCRAKNLCSRHDNSATGLKANAPSAVLPINRGKYGALANSHVAVLPEASQQMSPARPTKNETVKREPKSYAQVESYVEQRAVQRNSGGLKPKVGKPAHIGIRLSLQERQLVIGRATSSGLKLSVYARSALLGADYVAKHDPVRRKLLQDLSTELGRQGNNLNQIARQLNSGFITQDEAYAMLNDMGNGLVSAHNAVRLALIEGKVMP